MSGETNPTASGGKSRVLVSSVIGSVIEWYDYTLYGTAAALVFNHLFFPQFSSGAGTVAAFGSFAVGFIARPIGGFVAGHYGDRIGRKATLVMTLLAMGISTTLIGLLPTYEAIGLWAPTLLIVLRLVQGFAVGGEWGGAVLMAVEHAPRNRRGLYGAWPQTGVSAGLLLGTGAFALMNMLPEEQFMSWGWRVPFLLSIVLAGVGLWVRYRITESPAFVEAQQTRQAQHDVVKAPLIEVFRRHPRELLIAIGARFAEGGNYYVFTVFILAYISEHVGAPRGTALTAVLIASALDIVALPIAGLASDRFGRRPVYIFGAVFIAVSAWPLFAMIETGNAVAIAAAISLFLVFGHAAVYGPLAAFYAELFPANVRYSGVSIGYQAASILLGGLTPLIASSLLLWSGGSSWPIIVMVAGCGVIAAVTMLCAPETKNRDLAAIDNRPRSADNRPRSADNTNSHSIAKVSQ
ncbi:MFS transporter [Rhodococcus sp. NPDC057529]|uniref:MFS transporter n=1 Tax=Rhodococcus sp. NPDC057529 TaxID=3346158 RepID=UPI0036721726